MTTEKLYGVVLEDITSNLEARIGDLDEVSNWLDAGALDSGESVMFGEPFKFGEVFELRKVERDIKFSDDADGLSLGIEIFEYEQDGEQGYMFACNSSTIGAGCDPFYAFSPRTDEAIGRVIAWMIVSFYGDWSGYLSHGIPWPNQISTD